MSVNYTKLANEETALAKTLREKGYPELAKVHEQNAKRLLKLKENEDGTRTTTD